MKLSKLNSGLLIGTGIAATLMVSLTLLHNQESIARKNSDNICQQIIKQDAELQQETLKQLQGKEGSPRSSIREILGEPYCVLPKASIRSGVITEAEAYQMSEYSRLIVAYENNQYIGYAIEGDSSKQHQPQRKQIEVKKVGDIESGEVIAGQRVIGGLGDISLKFNGSVKAPVTGVVDSEFVLVTEDNLIDSTRDCIIFSSAQMPAYLLKICGLTGRNLGAVDRGSPIGETGGKLHISLLSFRQVDNQTKKWIYVSPSKTLIEKLVS